jgi:thiamine biosynthesis lipoprotein
LTLKLGWNRKPVTLSETRLLIGTIVNLKVVTWDAPAGQQALTACFDQMSKLEMALSRFMPESELSRLNRDGHIEAASSALLGIIKLAQEISELSRGAFDVTILPVLSLYQDYASTRRGLPPEEEIQRARTWVDYRKLSVKGDTVSLAEIGMGVTLDGIAKGYIIDAATAVLQGHGFRDVLVKAGGDLMALGEDEQRSPWEIGIQSPRHAQGIVIARFGLEDRAVATSGDYMEHFATNFSEHHILDPRTGHSARELSSATIVAPTAILADALATAIMVLGSESGLELVNAFPGCKGCLVTKDQTLKVFGTW